MIELGRNLRACVSALSRQPGLAALAVIALAMGIGFTTAMFSIVRGGLRQLPFADPEQLLVVTRAHARLGEPDLDARPFDLQQWSAQQSSFTALAAFRTMPLNLSGDGERPQRVPAAAVTTDAFSVLGVQPILGRAFHPDDAATGAAAVIVIGHELWGRRFAGSPTVLGGTVRVDGVPRQIVGVMPEGFGFPVNADAWIPLGFEASTAPEQGEYLTVFGRLRQDVTLARAQADLDAIAGRLAEHYPDTHAELRIRAFPFVELEMPAGIARTLILMLGAVSFVLLIACANVANLLLARAAARTRDLAIRVAVGASRRHIIGHQLMESFVLAVSGALIGLGVSVIAVRFFALATAPIIEAFWMQFRVDGSALLFASSMTAIAAMTAGLAPALRASRTETGELLKHYTQGVSSLRLGRLSGWLVVGEIALSCALLIMTVMLVQAAVRLRATPFPFDTRGILTAQVGLPPATLADRSARNRLYMELARRLDSMPGVSSAALVSTLPGRGAGRWTFDLEDEPIADGRIRPTTGVAAITPDFLSVVGARALRGRELNWLDHADAPGVALANQSFVHRHSPATEVLGRRVRIGQASYTIVGVVPDLWINDIEEPRADGLYIPLLQAGPSGVRIMAGTRGEPLGHARALAAAVTAADADLPVLEMMTLDEAIYRDKRVLDAMGTLFFLFGLGALFLTVVGLYGVVSFSVAQRTREIGVRRALGARAGDVLALVMRGGLRRVALGLATGLALGYALSRAFAAGVEVAEPAGPLTFVAVAVSLGLTAMLALLVPAKRALGVSPNCALTRN